MDSGRQAPRRPGLEREWAEGVPVYYDSGVALEQAGLARERLGRFVVRIEIPEDSHLEVRKTMRDPNHYTIYASAQLILDLVSGEAIPIRIEP